MYEGLRDSFSRKYIKCGLAIFTPLFVQLRVIGLGFTFCILAQVPFSLTNKLSSSNQINQKLGRRCKLRGRKLGSMLKGHGMNAQLCLNQNKQKTTRNLKSSLCLVKVLLGSKTLTTHVLIGKSLWAQ